jgi:hypothetical protein
MVLHMQVKDINQVESMLQLPFEGNCLNWVIGHILDPYNTCVEWLGLPALLTPNELERSIESWMGKVTLIETLFFMVWHAHYHTGQIEQLRQLAGKHDKVL